MKETTFFHPLAKEAAPLPNKPLGADLSPGFETCLMGEATGAGIMPVEVPVKVEPGRSKEHLEGGCVPSLACEGDKKCAADPVKYSTKTGH